MKKVIALLGIAALVAGCGGPKATMVMCKDHPKWVDEGGAAFKGEKPKAFYGVGAASNISSPSLRRSVAEQKARADLARNFKTSVKDLVKVFDQSVSSANYEGQESAEQMAENVTKAFTEMDLYGAEITGHHPCEKENTLYALARLDPEAFKKQMETVQALPDAVKRAIIDDAERAFDDLDKQ